MENKIIKALKENDRNGLTIAELSKKLKFSRFIIRTALFRLEGADKVYFRKVNMAKIYSLKRGKK